MNTDRLRRLRGLLGTALGLAPEQRPDFVARAAAGDAELGAEIASLLAAAEREDPGLEPPVVAAAEVPALVAGERLGAWRLDRRIGAGGMGEVWLATRTDGAFAQRVAIKVPRAVGHGPAAFARFERERSLLAELEDPGVARLVDGGWTAHGRPWLAMEFVEGLPIDVHAEERGLDRRARVRLVLAACRALAAAHRRRIVHRDLKPGNVLVRDDGDVVLVDFGIAAALDGAAGAVGCLATPRYAAPEQLRGGAVTTAVDVYSLAVLARDLVGACDRDLGAVLAAATHADPELRTPTADAFAAELQRWLEHRPVDARPPTPGRRLRLWWRRAPGAAAAVLLLTALVVGLAVTSTVLWRAERIERQRTAAANESKDRRLAQVRALVRDLVFGVHDRVAALPGAVPVRTFVVERAEQHLTALAAEVADDPEIAREWIEVHLRLADVRGARTHGHHGDLEGALRSARASVAAASAWRGRRPTEVRWPLLEAKGHRQIGDLLRALGDTAAARAAYDRALDLAAANDDGAAAPERERIVAVTRLQRARLDLDGGDVTAGLAGLHVARQLLDALAAAAPAAREAGRDAALAHSALGFALSQLGREADAAAAWAEALRRVDALLATQPDDAQLRRERIELDLELTLALAHERHHDVSARFDRALADARALAGADATNVLAQRLLHRALLRGARLAELQGALPRCAALYREAEPQLRAALQHYGDDRSVRTDLAEALIARAEADRRRGAFDGVAAAYEEAVALLDADAALAAGDHLAGNLLTMAWVGLGQLALGTGDAVAARERFARFRDATAAWAARHAELPWPLRHLCALEQGLGSACESLAGDPSLPTPTRLEHLASARDAFDRGLAAVQRLADQGRLHGADKAMPMLLQLDVQRVDAERQRLTAAAR